MTQLNDWKADDLITADRLNDILSVVRGSSKEVNDVTFSDFADIAKNPIDYQGYWYSSNLTLANAPMGGWLLIKVTNARANAGLIEVYSTAYYQKKAWCTFGSGALNGWYYDEVTADSVSKTANNTFTGINIFTGKTQLGNYPTANVTQTVLGSSASINFYKHGQLVTMSAVFSGKTTSSSGSYTSLLGNIYPSGFAPAYNQQGAVLIGDSSSLFPIFINTGDVSIRAIAIPSGTANLTMTTTYVSSI